MKRLLLWLTGSLLLTLLVACGGGGGSAGTPTGSANPANFVVNAPSSMSVAIGQRATFTITGGKAPYVVFSSTPGLVSASADGTTLSITGLQVGVTSVRVSPTGGGAEFNMAVTVMSSAVPLAVQSPDSITLGVGNALTYTVVGGVPPYQVTSANPSVMSADITGSQVRVTGVAVGASSFNVFDSTSTSQVVKQVAVLQTNPFYTTAPLKNLTISIGSTKTYSVGGGVAPYTAVSNNSGVADASVAGATLSLVANGVGNATVSLRDAAGSVISVDLGVGAASAFYTNAPSQVTLQPGSTPTYAVGGGTPPYTATTANAAVLNASVAGSTLTLTPSGGGRTNVVLRDAVGSLLTIDATVAAATAFYTTAPTTVSLQPGTIPTYTIGGGIPPYTATSSNLAAVTPAIVGSALALSANSSGRATISLRDSSGALLSLDVTVAVATSFFTSAPSQITLAAGTTRTYTLGGGVSPYTASSANTAILDASVSGTALTLVGNTGGSATVVLRDAVGTVINLATTVGSSTALFTTAPSALAMQGGTSRQFSVSGGAGGYSVAASDSSVVNVSISGSGTLTIVAQGNGVASVDITDAAGARASVSVTVTNAASASVSKIDVTTDKSSLQSAGEEAVISAFVKNTSNVAVPNVPILFSASSGTLLSPSANTDASGVATVRLSSGSDKSARNVVVTAAVGSVTGTVNVAVVGSTLSITGSTAQQIGSPASTYSVRAVDSSGNAVVGIPLTVSSSLSNVVSPSTVVTDSTGSGSFTYTPSNAGSDVLTVSGLGTSKVFGVTVSAVNLSVLSPASGTAVSVGASQTVTVRYLNQGAAVNGATVAFSSTRGTVSATSALTNGSGDASVTVSSTTAGPATIAAQISGVGSVSVPITFAATTPASITLQASPSAVPPNPTGTVNQSTVQAVVRDAAGNLVANQQVNFTLVSDLSNGTLSAGTALTDSNGRASVQFVAGSTSTPSNGVKIQASVPSTSVSTTASLTVNGSALFITIGYGNTIENLDPTTYQKPFSVYVTDANGVAVGNQTITISAIPTAYGKGWLFDNGVAWVYQTYVVRPIAQGGDIPASPTAACTNEDVNANGTLDSGEDTNGDGRLTPGNIAVASPGSLTTDSAGRATFYLQYGEQYASWATVRITARATVSGTESTSYVDFALSGMSTDYATGSGGPASATSPFGTSSLCTNAL